VQRSQLQADLEQEWQVKCDHALAAAREQQRRETTELTEHIRLDYVLFSAFYSFYYFSCALFLCKVLLLIKQQR